MLFCAFLSITPGQAGGKHYRCMACLPLRIFVHHTGKQVRAKKIIQPRLQSQIRCLVKPCLVHIRELSYERKNRNIRHTHGFTTQPVMLFQTLFQLAERACIMSGFSVTQGAMTRYMRRTARPLRSRFSPSKGNTQTRNDQSPQHHRQRQQAYPHHHHPSLSNAQSPRTSSCRLISANS